MKMLSLNVIILLLFCYACLSTGNQKVYFVSKNFTNVLHWHPQKPASQGEEVLYSVRYKSYAEEQFRIKEECQNITALTCDLTAETPSVPNAEYLALVYVNGIQLGRTSSRFKPIADTILGPPILSTRTTVSSVYVNVTLPLGPNGVSIADIIRRSKNGPSETVIVYTLTITEPKWAAMVNQTTTGQFVINVKNNQTKYCGHVGYKPSCEWGRSGSEDTSFCVTLQDDPWKFLPWLFMGAALLATVVTTLVVWMCNYVKGGKQKNKPQSLVITPGSQWKVFWPPKSRIIISKPVVSTQKDRTVYVTIQVKPNVPPVRSGGYSPQVSPWQAWEGSNGSSVCTAANSPPPNPQDRSTQSSETYGAVAIHVPTEENFQQATTEDGTQPSRSTEEPLDKGGASPKLTLHGVSALPDLDGCESNTARPLLLHTVRDTKGRLILPSLSPQLQSGTGDTVSPLDPERKLLLSDLIESKKESISLASLQSCDSYEWSDSGCDDSIVSTPTQPHCDTHYVPPQPIVPDFHQQCKNITSSEVIVESSYKQNWMPEVILGASSKYSGDYRRTNLSFDVNCSRKGVIVEGDEDRREEEGSEQILLGSWMAQIQEEFSTL